MKPNNARNGEAKASSASRLVIVVTVLIGLAVIASLIIASYFLKDGAERVKFLTESLLSAAILAVVVVQALIYDQQRRLMEQQRDLTAIAERAYLGIKGMKIDNPIVGNTIVITIHFVNGGRTPARNVRRLFQVGLVEGPPRPFEWDNSAATEEFSFFAAGAERRLTPPKILGVTKEMFVQFEAGKGNIYVDGELRFEDYRGIEQIFAFGMTCRFSDNGEFTERYQYQRDANPA